MVRLVLRLSPLAKGAALVAAAGGILAIYGNLRDIEWARGLGAVLLFGGAIVYWIERFRMMRKKRSE